MKSILSRMLCLGIILKSKGASSDMQKARDKPGSASHLLSQGISVKDLVFNVFHLAEHCFEDT